MSVGGGSIFFVVSRRTLLLLVLEGVMGFSRGVGVCYVGSWSLLVFREAIRVYLGRDILSGCYLSSLKCKVKLK